MTGIENSFIFWTNLEDSTKATIYDEVQMLTFQGYYVWQIARILGITECQVVALQGRA